LFFFEALLIAQTRKGSIGILYLASVPKLLEVTPTAKANTIENKIANGTKGLEVPFLKSKEKMY